LLDTEAWWMWSQNLGAICAHSVAGALTSKLSVRNDPLRTLRECNFHNHVELCCGMWWLYFLRCSCACFVQCCVWQCTTDQDGP
jgi:hypothetical protein